MKLRLALVRLRNLSALSYLMNRGAMGFEHSPVTPAKCCQNDNAAPDELGVPISVRSDMNGALFEPLSRKEYVPPELTDSRLV